MAGDNFNGSLDGSGSFDSGACLYGISDGGFARGAATGTIVNLGSKGNLLDNGSFVGIICDGGLIDTNLGASVSVCRIGFIIFGGNFDENSV